MRRRDLLAMLGGAAAAWPLAARAQQPRRVRRIGVLMNLAADDPEGRVRLALFVRGLQEAGWADGRNVEIDKRWAAGDAGQFPKYAAELIALEPEVILATTTPAVMASQQASRTVPIVFLGVVDPVGSGLIASMLRPGGNATGFVLFEYALAAKWLQLLKDVAPGVTRAAVLREQSNTTGIGQFAAIQTVATIGLELSTAICAMPARSSAPSRHSRRSQTAA
jgi:putative ABC transport system substrate-binding protein